MLAHMPAALVILLLLAFGLIKLLYEHVRNPLRKVPAAHPLAHFTSLWIHSVRWRGIENATLKKAHQQYGPIVCLSPQEISVNCVKGGIREVYAGGFEKGNSSYNWYGFFSNYGGVHNMFSTKNNKPHSIRKRMLSNIYSKSFLASNDALRAQVFRIIYDRFLPGLERAYQEHHPGGFNIYTFLSATTMDIVTGYIFGLKASSNLIDDAEQLNWILELYNSRRSLNFWPQEFPRLTEFLDKWFHYRLSPNWIDEANGEIEAWTLKMCEGAREVLATDDARYPENRPVVYQQLQQALIRETKSNGAVLQPEHIASEVLDHLAAGFDTSSITLTYVVHELSRNAPVQALLQAELQCLEPALIASSSPDLPGPKSIDALPVLHAVIWETLRLRSAIPGPQPRFAPSQGCVLGPEEKSYLVPGGTRVSASAGLLHLNEDVYERATEWRPERWLNLAQLDEERRKDMENRWFWAFGSGGRMCVGSHLAVYQMKFIVAAIYTNYRTAIVDDTDMEQSDAYTAPPKSDKLMVRLEKLRM